jgi:hypothetical protein
MLLDRSVNPTWQAGYHHLACCLASGQVGQPYLAGWSVSPADLPPDALPAVAWLDSEFFLPPMLKVTM